MACMLGIKLHKSLTTVWTYPHELGYISSTGKWKIKIITFSKFLTCYLQLAFGRNVQPAGVQPGYFKGGGHTGSNNIVMEFLPQNIVGCLLKRGL